MGIGSIVLTVLLIIFIPCIFVLAWYLDEVTEKKHLKLFKPGMNIEYYTHFRHGKFRREELLYRVTIKDIDGEYALVVQNDTMNEYEINLQIEMKYCKKMVLKNNDGTIVKEFGFEL